MSFPRLRASLAALAMLTLPCTLASANDGPRVTVITHFDIIPNGDNVVQAETLLKKFVLDSRSDPGVLSFTLITWAPTTNHFQLIEVFGSLDAFDRHVSAAHTIAFRTAVQPFVGSPLDERLYTRNKHDDDR